MLTIKQSDKSFYVGDSEKSPLAEMTFVYAGEDIIIIDHTSVSDKLRGRSIGEQLLQRLVELAKEKNKKIVPLCPFAKKEMTKNKEEYEEILVN